jgi:hypothetical protein
MVCYIEKNCLSSDFYKHMLYFFLHDRGATINVSHKKSILILNINLFGRQIDNPSICKLLFSYILSWFETHFCLCLAS